MFPSILKGKPQGSFKGCSVQIAQDGISQSPNPKSLLNYMLVDGKLSVDEAFSRIGHQSQKASKNFNLRILR